MKEILKENKKFIIIALVIIVLLLIGITYAYLRTTLEGEKEYVIRAGTLDLTVNFEFIISNNFKNKITYKVSNKKVYI